MRYLKHIKDKNIFNNNINILKLIEINKKYLKRYNKSLIYYFFILIV